MRKRTNWSANVITGTPQQNQTVNTDKPGAGNSKSGLVSQQDRNQGWSGFQQQGASIDPSGINSIGKSGGPFGKDVRWRGRNSADLPGILQAVGKILLVIAGAAIIIGIIIGLVKIGPAMLAVLKEGIQKVFELLINILVIALVLWILAMATIGRFLPAKLKPYSFLIVVGLIILCAVSPESAVCIFIIIGMAIWLTGVFKH